MQITVTNTATNLSSLFSASQLAIINRTKWGDYKLTLQSPSWATTVYIENWNSTENAATSSTSFALTAGSTISLPTTSFSNFNLITASGTQAIVALVTTS